MSHRAGRNQEVQSVPLCQKATCPWSQWVLCLLLLYILGIILFALVPISSFGSLLEMPGGINKLMLQKFHR